MDTLQVVTELFRHIHGRLNVLFLDQNAASIVFLTLRLGKGNGYLEC